MVRVSVFLKLMPCLVAAALLAGDVSAAERRSVLESRARESKKETSAAGGGSITANVLLVVKTGPVTFGPDTAATMPTSDTTTFNANDVFNLEVWAQTINNATGLAAVSLDINFDPAELQVTNNAAFPFNPPGLFHTFTFNVATNGSVDNVGGKVDDLSGGYLQCGSSPVGNGPTNWARIAVVEMQAVVAGSPTITPTGTGNPVFGLAPCNQSDLPQSAITYIGINEPTADLILNIASGSEKVTQGDTVTATLEVANLATAINGVQALFSYDDSLLQLDSIVPTDLGLTQPDEGWIETFESDVSGDVAYSAIINGGSTSADGVVATVTFTAIGTGTSNLAFLGDNPPSHPTLENRLTDAATAQAISPALTDSGNMTVNACDDELSCTTDTFDGNACVFTLDAGNCLIGGVCVADGVNNPANECEECNAGADPNDWSDVANGTVCDDGDLCTQTDTCQAGVCTSANPVICTALDQCHDVGVCDPGTGLCDNPEAKDGITCDDGDLCTQTDTCQSGVCTGSNPVVCTPLDQCHVAGTCDPGTGVCSDPDAPNGTGCNDGDLCTQTDTCQAGVCTGSNPVVCTPLSQCHVAGTCNPGTGVCSNPTAADGTGCDDGDLCTQTDECVSGACDGLNPVVCTPLDQCHVAGTCDPGTGLCDDPNAPNGTGCDDGQACTEMDACLDGACEGDVIDGCIVCKDANDCDDGNDCTMDACVDSGCVFTDLADGASCDDGDLCTQTDECMSGVCVGSNSVVCTVLDQCHDVGTCDPGTGVCDNPNAKDGISCDDSDLCTQTDTCQSGVCTGSNPVVCTPLSQCHDVGTCDPATGICDDPIAKDGISCDDGNLCTQTDVCMSGVCEGSNPVVCMALSQCHDVGTCDPATGVCDDPIAKDGISCDDNNLCTQTDTCQSGVCTGANPIVCTPLDQCHVAGTCDPGTGLCDDPNAPNGTGCDDGDLCTQTDECVDGVCDGSNPVVCTPLSQCHDAGVCDPGTGVCDDPVAQDGTVCNDGMFCTTADQCIGGACQGLLRDCDDFDPCTDDSCDEDGDACVNDEMITVLLNIDIPALTPVAAVTRTVAVIFTDCEGGIDVHQVPVVFDTGGSGSVLLTDVSRDMDWIHVAERHTLGRALPLVFDGVDGCDATADFIGSDALLSGDFGNGTVSQDNLVDVTDAAILSINWEQAIDPNSDTGADANGDGLQDGDDFTILQNNFAVAGDPFNFCPSPSTSLDFGVTVAATSLRVDDLPVPNAFLADKNADGWFDYRDIEQFAAEKGIRLTREFRAKLRGVNGTTGFDRPSSKR